MDDKNNMNCRNNPFSCATAHTCCKRTLPTKIFRKLQ